MSRIGMRNRGAQAQRVRPDRPATEPGVLQAPSRQQDEQRDNETDGDERRRGEHHVVMVGSAAETVLLDRLAITEPP